MRRILFVLVFLLIAFGAQAQQFPTGFAPGATFHVPVMSNTTLLGENGALVTYKGSLRLSDDADGMRRIHVNNLSAGWAAQSALLLQGPAGTAGPHTWFVQEGIGYGASGSGGAQAPNSAGLISSTGQPFWLAAPRFDFWLARINRMSIDEYGLRPHYNNETYSQLFFNRGDSHIWASIFSGGWDNLNITAGAYFHNGWIGVGPGAQLINLASDNTIGIYPQWPWVRNAYFDQNGLHLPQRNDGTPYDLGLNGRLVSWARPWDGKQTVDSSNVYAWIPNGTCYPVTYHSGYIQVTEDWYWGLTCGFIAGGNSITRMAYSFPGSGGQCSYYVSSCGSWSNGAFHMCYEPNGWYYLCNNIGADTYFRVMMLKTRAST